MSLFLEISIFEQKLYISRNILFLNIFFRYKKSLKSGLIGKYK